MKLLVTVVRRGRGESVTKLISQCKVDLSVITFGEGTASSQMLEYLSLSDTKKDVVFSLIDSSDEKEILDLLNHHFHIKKNNHGIAFTIALTSINSLSLKQIMGNEGL